MKFTLTIQDLTADQVNETMNKITGTEQTVNVSNVVNVEPTGVTVPTTAEHATASEAINKGMLTAPIVETPNTASSIVNPIVTPEIELDTTGIPWDKRIHGGKPNKKSMKTDGSWKRRRNVDDAVFDAIEAELVASVTGSVAVETPAVPTPPVMPQAPAAPTPPVAQAAAVEPIGRDFQGLMTHLTNLFQAGSVDQLYAQTIVTRINQGFVNDNDVATVTDISGNAQMVEFAWQCIDIDKKGL